MNSRLWNHGAAEAIRPNRVAHSLIAAHGREDGLAVAETAFAAVISSGEKAQITLWAAVIEAIKIAQASPMRLPDLTLRTRTAFKTP